MTPGYHGGSHQASTSNPGGLQKRRGPALVVSQAVPSGHVTPGRQGTRHLAEPSAPGRQWVPLGQSWGAARQASPTSRAPVGMQYPRPAAR